jgi:hypothetical protein
MDQELAGERSSPGARLCFSARASYTADRKFVRRGPGILDTWESFFREKSLRRSRAFALKWRSAVGWALMSLAFLRDQYRRQGDEHFALRSRI